MVNIRDNLFKSFLNFSFLYFSFSVLTVIFLAPKSCVHLSVLSTQILTLAASPFILWCLLNSIPVSAEHKLIIFLHFFLHNHAFQVHSLILRLSQNFCYPSSNFLPVPETAFGIPIFSQICISVLVRSDPAVVAGISQKLLVPRTNRVCPFKTCKGSRLLSFTFILPIIGHKTEGPKLPTDMPYGFPFRQLWEKKIHIF